MKVLHLSALIGILILGQALAARPLNVRALAMANDPKMPERYLQTEDGYVPLAFSAMQPSELVKAVSGESLLPLFELKKNTAGEPTYEMADKVKLPAGAKGVLLLGWVTPEGARYLAIDDDYLAAKYNDWLLINASPKAVAFQMGLKEKPLLIGANSVKHHKLNTPKEAGLSVVGQAEWGDKVKTFYSTYWPIRGKERGIVIFYERGERIGVKKITDILLKPKEVADTSTSR